MIWNRVPKEVFVGAEVLELGVLDAVSHFNIGSQAALNVLTSTGIQPGQFFNEEMRSSSKLRLSKANYKERCHVIMLCVTVRTLCVTAHAHKQTRLFSFEAFRLDTLTWCQEWDEDQFEFHAGRL